MEKEFFYILLILQIKNMMGNGLMENFMEMEYLSGKMVHNIMENIFLAKNKVLVHLFFKIIIFIKEIG